MISVNNLTIHFGGRSLFNGITFNIAQADKIGLVGKNGAGKSTLLKTIVSGSNQSVNVPKGYCIGYLSQHIIQNEDNTVFFEASKAFEEINSLENRLEEVQHQLTVREDYESDEYIGLIEEISYISDRLAVLDTGSIEEKVVKVLRGLGFTPEDFDKPLKQFSGGWKMRVELAKILLQPTDALFLDEPTNHLDITSIIWLEQFLKSYTGAILLISHDRRFLDNITNRTVELYNGKIYDYKFSYSKYIEQRVAEIELQQRAAKNQAKEIQHTKELIDKFRAKKNKAAFAQSLIKKLERTELVEVDEMDSTAFNLRFPPSPRSGKEVVRVDHIGKQYGSKTVLRDISFSVAAKERIALVGKNGIGKSTLLKLIAGKETASSGASELGHNVLMGYFAQDQADRLDPKITVFETIDNDAIGDQRKAVRAMLGSFLFGRDEIDKKVSVLSGGEKTRLAICRMLLSPINLLILDEPTNHLDLASKEVLKEAIMDYDGTLMIVSHDRDFLTGLCNKVYEIRDGELKEHFGGIEEFLELQQAESIQDFERSGPSVLTTAVTNDKVKTADQQREAEKELKRLKSKSHKLEEEINALEGKAAELTALIAKSPANLDKLLREYEGVKTEIDLKMKQWEEVEQQVMQMS
ncbi:MAG TPA: ABC-F family ATP-binding cassette domain-containing protein [Luteibaculaceae bacterium]|nr:ABC-F family ATP-binding cassette domain-containing protein [Luteibaculaceae bacterium]